MRDPNHPRTQEIPEATFRRLPTYYRTLQGMSLANVSQVSCADLARLLKLDPTLVRKDIEMTGIVGKPRVGYALADLLRRIELFLGWNRPKGAVLVGTGSLGSALLGYDRFRSHGMEIVAAFDVDRHKIGQRVHGRAVQSLDALPDFVQRTRILMGVIATPADAAQSIANLMSTAGIKAIWNFAPANLQVPAGVILQNEDLYYSLAFLSFKLESQLGELMEDDISYAQEN